MNGSGDPALTKNPFHLLDLSIRASREEVVDAYEEALATGRADENLLVQAQQALLTPRLRIAAELSWFPCSHPSRARDILAILEENNPADADRVLVCLRGLDRANLAANLCARSDGKSKYVNKLLETYGDLTIEDVQETLKVLRSVSGFPSPDQQQIGEALAYLRTGHAKAAITCIVANSGPGEALTKIVKTYLDEKDDNVRQLLDLIVRGYDSWSQPHLARIKERIESDIAQYRSGAGQSPVGQLVKLLAEWDPINKPVRLLDESKGHEEPRSKEICGIVRAFGAWLANEKQKDDDALTLFQALLDTFPELPIVAAQLSWPIKILQSKIRHGTRQ